MQNAKKVLMVIPHMLGGGAERVAAQLINELNNRGYDTTFILTSSKKNEVVNTDLNERTPLVLLTEELKRETVLQKLCNIPKQLISTVIGKMYEKKGKLVPAYVGKASIECQYHREIKYIRQVLKDNPDMTVIAFLQPAIPITVLAAKGLPNKVIISERGDPSRLMKKRYGKKFIGKYYNNVNAAVFQTEDAKAVYPENVSKKGTVISNPIKAGLPEAYFGERNDYITTFCRISKQKNLPVLIEAFAKIHDEHREYILRIIGDTFNKEGEEVLAFIKNQINELGIVDSVVFEPFMKNVHEAIIKDAMYVNSSDYEGISNAMLEAMAIGMPVVCTDCPIGGAKATIKDGENGLLVPIKDSDKLYKAIKRVMEEDGLADKLSKNAAKLREELSLEVISEKWCSLI